MTASQPSRSAEGKAAGRDPNIGHGVLLWSGLICPASGPAIAAEQAERLGGVECLIDEDVTT